MMLWGTGSRCLVILLLVVMEVLPILSRSNYGTKGLIVAGLLDPLRCTTPSWGRKLAT